MMDPKGFVYLTCFLAVAMLLNGCGPHPSPSPPPPATMTTTTTTTATTTATLRCPLAMMQTMRDAAQDQANVYGMPVGMGYAGPDKTGNQCSMGYVAYPRDASANGICQVPASQRRDCGNNHIKQHECEAAGCCWQPHEGSNGVPWCFCAHSDNKTHNEMFLFGSFTKVWTASALLKLKNEGKIGLDEPAFNYMEPAYQSATGESLVKPFGDRIKEVTIRQLLAMRASIDDYDEIEYQAAHPLEDLGPARSVQLFGEGKMISNLPPGDCGMYSSMAYVLLGLVLLGQSGKTFDTYDQNVWREQFPGIRFGVHGTCSMYTDLAGDCSDCRSRGVEAKDMSCTGGYTCGNLIGSPEDVARFALALFSGELLGPRTTEEMLTGQPLGPEGVSGTTNPSDCNSFDAGDIYGLGVELHRDSQFPGHEGVTYGFASQTKYDKVSKAAYVAAIPTSNPGMDDMVGKAWYKLWSSLNGNHHEAVVV